MKIGSDPISALYESSLKSLPRLGRGKVRDIYAVGDDKMLIVASDRLSAFDVILPDPIPEKGRVLNEMANFWFGKLGHIVPNQLTGIDPQTVVKGEEEKAQVQGRSVVVKKLKPLPIEAVVRGYIIGSGWKDYQKTGRVCGIELPKGLQQAQKLPSPIFTPATKAESGHDENISFEEVVKLIGYGRRPTQLDAANVGPGHQSAAVCRQAHRAIAEACCCRPPLRCCLRRRSRPWQKNHSRPSTAGQRRPDHSRSLAEILG